jgi:hypothetical protein
MGGAGDDEEGWIVSQPSNLSTSFSSAGNKNE